MKLTVFEQELVDLLEEILPLLVGSRLYDKTNKLLNQIRDDGS